MRVTDIRVRVGRRTTDDNSEENTDDKVPEGHADHDAHDGDVLRPGTV
jgi:hypothetical protein